MLWAESFVKASGAFDVLDFADKFDLAVRGLGERPLLFFSEVLDVDDFFERADSLDFDDMAVDTLSDSTSIVTAGISVPSKMLS